MTEHLNAEKDPTRKTREDFIAATGDKPELDDLERVNCLLAGSNGHRQCGWCREHNKPRFVCGCLG